MFLAESYSDGRTTHLDLFVRESHLIAGLRQKSADQEYLSAREQAHRVLVECVLGAEIVLDPMIVNHALFHSTDHHNAGRYRMGVSADSIGKIPLAEYLPKMIEEWKAKAEMICEEKGTEEEIRLLIFELLSLRPFQQGNWLTARLLENNLRLLCGHPWKIFFYRDARSEGKAMRKHRKCFKLQQPKERYWVNLGE